MWDMNSDFRTVPDISGQLAPINVSHWVQKVVNYRVIRKYPVEYGLWDNYASVNLAIVPCKVVTTACTFTFISQLFQITSWVGYTTFYLYSLNEYARCVLIPYIACTLYCLYYPLCYEAPDFVCPLIQTVPYACSLVSYTDSFNVPLN